MTLFWPSCNCCGCELFRFPIQSSIDDWTIESGAWEIDEQVVPWIGPSTRDVLICTADGEITLNKSVPAEFYAAILVRVREVGDVVSLIVANADHEIALTLTVGDADADSAGTVSLTLDAVEQFPTLPQTTGFVHQSYYAAGTGNSIILYLCRIDGLLRALVGSVRRLAVFPTDQWPIYEAGTQLPIAWAPSEIRIAAEPAGADIGIVEARLSRAETADTVCVQVHDCEQVDKYAAGGTIDSLGADIVDTIVGDWELEFWEVNEYAADATVVPWVGFFGGYESIRPRGISITEDVRDRGYKVNLEYTWFIDATADRLDYCEAWACLFDGGAHELRVYAQGLSSTVMVGGFPVEEWEITIEVWRGATLLGSATASPLPESTKPTAATIHIGGERIVAQLYDAEVDVATVATYGGEWARFDTPGEYGVGDRYFEGVARVIEVVGCPLE